MRSWPWHPFYRQVSFTMTFSAASLSSMYNSKSTNAHVTGKIWIQVKFFSPCTVQPQNNNACATTYFCIHKLATSCGFLWGACAWILQDTRTSFAVGNLNHKKFFAERYNTIKNWNYPNDRNVRNYRLFC